ncbi:hypothetical protein F5Y09DRAFT_327232 [Xylaria sp. FL1042]|nr:hypothetical protein F5Y09DRAFT_327232 [Xylaria sp. FL1042]
MAPSHASDRISRLSNELLLQIFHRDPTSTALAACALCCKRWNRLGTSVRYKHVTLTTTHKLLRWAGAAPPLLDSLIQTFTVGITTPRTVDGWLDKSAIEQLPIDLDQLAIWVRQMINLKAFFRLPLR